MNPSLPKLLIDCSFTLTLPVRFLKTRYFEWGLNNSESLLWDNDHWNKIALRRIEQTLMTAREFIVWMSFLCTCSFFYPPRLRVEHGEDAHRVRVFQWRAADVLGSRCAKGWAPPICVGHGVAKLSFKIWKWGLRTLNGPAISGWLR